MKHNLFFALKEDLLPLLDFVESKGPLKYVRMGNFPGPEVMEGAGIFRSGRDLPNLGRATADSSAASESFLVCQPETEINLRRLSTTSGGERVCVDQLANPDSVEFKPGGVWNEDIVLHGRIATASESEISQALMKRFETAIRKTFSKVKAFYVGANALALLENGKRLTIAAQSPRELDLTEN